MTDHNKNLDSTKTPETTEIVKQEPAGGVTLRKERAATKKILEGLDKARLQRLPDATPMVELWQECNDDFDTNQAILNNLKSVQLRIEAQTEEYWIHKRQIEERLWEIHDKGPDHYDEYKVAQDASVKQDAEEWKALTGLMRLCQVLAKEFRACSMERKVNVHVNQVKLLFEAFKGVMDKHVYDEGIRGAMQADLRPIYLALFPIDVRKGG